MKWSKLTFFLLSLTITYPVAHCVESARSNSADIPEATSSAQEADIKVKEDVLRPDPRLPKEIAVVGAGMAGLSAARRLTTDRSNFTVQVYEARRERFGGRVWTDKLTNIKAKGPEVDLGGFAFTPAGKSNPLLELAEDFDLKSVAIEELQFFIPWEKRVISGEEMVTVTDEAEKILEQAVNESKTSKIEMSMKEAVDLVLKNGKVSLSDSASANFVRCFPSYVLEDFAAKHHRSDLQGMGYQKVLIDGMGELTDRLLSGNLDEPPLHLHLNKPARQIKIDRDANKVAVRFTDGSQIKVDAVVIAVPITVIASGDLQFEPALPKDYQVAAHELVMSHQNKVIVEFEQTFWPKDVGVFVRAVKTEGERGHLQTWVNIHPIVGVPALSGVLVGRPAKAFEELTDQEAEEAVLAVLTEMFGKSLVGQGGKMVRLQRSAWMSDPWTKGAVTYPRAGSDPALWDVFSRPLCPGVYFAGEHTTFADHGTLQGAYTSGLRAADQVMEDLCGQLKRQREEEEERERRCREEKKRKEKKGKETGREGESESGEESDDSVTDEDGSVKDEL